MIQLDFLPQLDLVTPAIKSHLVDNNFSILA